MKSSGVKNSEYDGMTSHMPTSHQHVLSRTCCLDSDGYEFYIVSLDNKQWHFEALSLEEREEWVSAIEQQILSCLQLNESTKAKKQCNVMEAATIQAIRSRVPGNGNCVDCDAPSKFHTDNLVATFNFF